MTTLADVRKAFDDNPLPEKLSDCIDVALDDLEKAEGSERYIVNMERWHLPSLTGECFVCLAGSTICSRVDEPGLSVHPPDLGHHARARLCALDGIRGGNVGYALRCMGRSLPASVCCLVPVARYGDSPTQFKATLRHIAQMLREAGE